MGKRWLFLVVDSFTKYVWGDSFPTKESKPVAQYLFNLYMVEGRPGIIQHDNGGEFISHVMQDLQKFFGIEDVKTAPYHPQSDGQVERVNSTIKKKLAMVIESTKNPWSQCLPIVLFQYNNSVHSTTKAVPFEALRGRTGTTLDDGKTLDQLMEFQNKLHESIRVSTQKAALKMIEKHSKKTKVINYEIGDIVMCRLPPAKREKKSLESIYKYEGEIVEIGKSTSYKYRIKWGSTGGPTKEEVCGSLSKRMWCGKFLKLVKKVCFLN